MLAGSAAGGHVPVVAVVVDPGAGPLGEATGGLGHHAEPARPGVGRGDPVDGAGRQVELQLRRNGQRGSGCDHDVRETGERGISVGGVVVPAELLDLMPLVGTHDDHVVAVGDVDEELGGGDGDVEPVVVGDHRFEHRHPVLEARTLDLVLAEDPSAVGQHDAVEPALRSRCSGDGQVGRRRRVERSRVHADPLHRDRMPARQTRTVVVGIVWAGGGAAYPTSPMVVSPEPIASQRPQVEGAIDVLTTADFIDELHRRLATARHRIVLQLMTFDGDESGQTVARLLLDAVARGVPVRLLVDSFALRFVSDRPVTDPAVRAEYEATLAMYDDLAAGGVDVRFTNANGPGHVFALARNHKKLYVIDDVAYLGGINVSDHNFEWHDFMVRITDHDVCATLLADLADTFAGHYTAVDRTITHRGAAGGEPVTVTVVTNEALRATFDRMIAGARERIVVASPYALDRRLLAVLRRSAAPEKTVVIADHNNFKFLHAITPYLTARARRAGIRLAAYDRFSHSKYLLVDDELLVGSSNFGRHSLTCNQEVGLVIRDPAFIADFESIFRTGLVPATPSGSVALRGFGWFATIVMEAYLAGYAKLVAPRVRLLAEPPGRE